MQNLTARYNYLHNAKIQLLAYEAQLLHEFPFKHQSLLPLYQSPLDTATERAPLDRIIVKAQLIISEKSYSNYIADSYLLLAKAQYLKGNYFLAEAYYRYVVNNYPQDLLVLTEALSGEARSVMQLGKPDAAKPIIEMLKAKLRLIKKHKIAPLLTLAQYHIFLKQYELAIVYLEDALSAHPDPQQMDISQYVLAQLYEIQKNYPRALQHYRSVKNAPFIYFNTKKDQQSLKDKSVNKIILDQYSPHDPDVTIVDTIAQPLTRQTDQFKQKKLH